jgi:hypothetical protein
VAALVGEKPDGDWATRHQSAVACRGFLVRHGVGGEEHRRTKIFTGELGICAEKFGLSRALAEFATVNSTGIRVSRITGFPTMIFGSISIRSLVATAPPQPWLPGDIGS